jgi:hypothetical protein
MDPSLSYEDDGAKEFRRSMMRVMSEVSLNPANVVPELQEELAMFMVGELKGLSKPNTLSSDKWDPDFLGVSCLLDGCYETDDLDPL